MAKCKALTESAVKGLNYHCYHNWTGVPTDALVPVEVLYKADGTFAAISSGKIYTSILTHLLIATLIHVLTRRATGVRLIASWTRTAVTARGIVTGAQGLTATCFFAAFVYIYTHRQTRHTESRERHGIHYRGNAAVTAVITTGMGTNQENRAVIPR